MCAHFTAWLPWLHLIHYPDAERRTESVCERVSVTGEGIPFCCIIQCTSERNSSQGKCLLQGHLDLLHQGRTRNKIPFVRGGENKNKYDAVSVTIRFSNLKHFLSSQHGAQGLHILIILSLVKVPQIIWH